MTKRLTIPRNSNEAERFLWHVSCHIANVYHNTTSDSATETAKQAMDIIHDKLDELAEPRK